MSNDAASDEKTLGECTEEELVESALTSMRHYGDACVEYDRAHRGELDARDAGREMDSAERGVECALRVLVKRIEDARRQR
jgi:hypothetical protein